MSRDSGSRAERQDRNGLGPEDGRTAPEEGHRPTSGATQEIINRLKECPHCGAEADDAPLDASHAGPYIHDEDVITCGGCGIMFIGTVEQWNSRALTNLTPSGVERIRALVREMEELPEDLRLIVALTDDGRKLRAMLESAALPSEPPSQGDVEGRPRLTGPEINRLQCAAAFLRSGCFPMPGYADDVEAAIRALASKEDGRS